MKERKHVIERIGYGKRIRYVIRELIGNTLCPVNGKVYRTIEEAQEEAYKLGLNITAIGDVYSLI